VALSACLAKPLRVDVVFLVASEAGPRWACTRCSLVAIPAGYSLMDALQQERGLAMVEGGCLPSVRAMTLGALRAKQTLVGFVVVTGIAVPGRACLHTSYVAPCAFERRMAPRLREGDLVVAGTNGRVRDPMARETLRVSKPIMPRKLTLRIVTHQTVLSQGEVVWHWWTVDVGQGQ
jgi:hypothetical protein